MHNEIPEVTIATVCYNVVKSGRANLFRNCVDSISSQSCRSVEHLVVDGGSADGTVDLLRECERPGFRWLSEKDNGIYDAMNKAIRLAAGKYLAFINSDDMLSDIGAVAAVKAALDESGADFVYANANVYSADHSQLIRTWKSRIDDIPYGYYPCHQTVFCRTDVLREIGGFSEEYMANDNLLMLRLVDRYKAHYLDRVVVNFHEGGASEAMVADKDRMKEETVSFFHDEVGKRCGLTREDCERLYEMQCFYLSDEEVIDIGTRLGSPVWTRRYFEVFMNMRKQSSDQERQNIVADYERRLMDSHRVIRLKLFGRIPLFRVDV